MKYPLAIGGLKFNFGKNTLKIPLKNPNYTIAYLF